MDIDVSDSDWLCRTVPVGPDQLLLRGAMLRNTHWIFGIRFHQSFIFRGAPDPECSDLAGSESRPDLRMHGSTTTGYPARSAYRSNSVHPCLYIRYCGL